MPKNQPTMSQMRQAMAEGANLLKSASARVAELEQKVYQYEMKEFATKLADAMHAKNLSPSWGGTREQTIKSILSMPRDKLAAVSQAVEMAAPHDPFARLDQNMTAGAAGAGRGGSALEMYILGMID